MSKSLVLISFLFVQNAMASIPGSTYELRHQKAIETAVTNDCGVFKNLVQTASEQEEIRIDQGIRDVRFTTTLIADKNYEISVESYYSDSYDHEARDWGHYSVTSVQCN